MWNRPSRFVANDPDVIECARRIALRQLMDGDPDPDDGPGTLRFRWFIRELLRTRRTIREIAELERGGWTPELTSWLDAATELNRSGTTLIRFLHPVQIADEPAGKYPRADVGGALSALDRERVAA